MSACEELERLAWRMRSYCDFARSRSAILGWFSHHNLGDDAAEICFNHFFNNQLAVITPQTYRRIPANLKVLICGGGGWLNRDAPVYFLKYISRIKNRSFPCLFLAGGINRDYADQKYSDNFPVFQEFMKHFDYVATRDEMSRQLLVDLGLSDVHVMPDVVLSLPGDDKTVDPVQKRDLKTVGLVLATHNQTVKNDLDRVRRFLVDMSDLLITRGYKVVCIPFQVDTNSSFKKSVDEIGSAKILQKDVKNPTRFQVLDCMMMAPDTLSYIKQHISVMVSMRLHGNIMAAVAGVPFISLSYNYKHKGFLEMMRMSEYDVPLDQDVLRIEQVMDILTCIENDYNRVSHYISVQSDRLRNETKRQVDAVRLKYGL